MCLFVVRTERQLSNNLKKFGKIRILYPLNQKYDNIELSKDVEYRIVGVVLEKKKRYL